MSKNKLGRNPFDKAKAASTSSPVELTPAPIEAAPEPSRGTTPSRTKTKKATNQEELTAPIVGEFIDLPEEESDEITAPRSNSLLGRLLVDLPAETFVFSLKTKLLFRSLLK